MLHARKKRAANYSKTHLFHCRLLKRVWGQRVGVGKSISVISLGQVETDIVQRLALREMVVVRIRQKRGSHTTEQRFRKSMLHIESAKAARSDFGFGGRHVGKRNCNIIVWYGSKHEQRLLVLYSILRS